MIWGDFWLRKCFGLFTSLFQSTSNGPITCTVLGNTLLELQIKGEVTVHIKYDGKIEKIEKFRPNGDSVTEGGRILMILEPNQSFTLQILDANSKCLFRHESQSESYCKNTITLNDPDNTFENVQTQVLEQNVKFQNKNKKYLKKENLDENDKLVISVISFNGTGKSSTLNELLRIMKSDKVPFIVGKNMNDLSNHLFKYIPNQNEFDKINVTKEMMKHNVDVESFTHIQLIDCPGLAYFNPESGECEKFEETKNYLNNIYEKLNVHSLFLTIPYNPQLYIKEGSQLTKIYSGMLELIDISTRKKIPLSCCYTNIDTFEIFKRYITKSCTIIDLRLDNDKEKDLKLEVLKLFYEWHFHDSLRSVVPSTRPIPFLCPIEYTRTIPSISNFIDLQYLTLLKYLIENACLELDTKYGKSNIE